MSSKTAILRAAFLAGVACQATMAIAQDSNAPGAPPATPTATMPTAPVGVTTAPQTSDAGDIVVTARKRAERLLDVPVAVTALNDQQLAKYGTTDLSAVGTQIPQVIFSKNPSGNGANISIRGVGTNTSADDGIEQAVSVNIDGVGTARGRVLQTGLFDVANVQVLKGPQALYFGKNSPGGVIVVETKGPTDTLQGYVRTGYEFSAHEYYGEAAVSGPITPTLGFRIAFRGDDMTQGYVHNIAQPISTADDPVAFDKVAGLSIPGRAFKWGPELKSLAGRLTLKWKPTSNFDATLKFLASDYRDQGDASTNVASSCLVGSSQPVTTDLSNALFTGVPGAAVDPNGVCGKHRVNTIGELPPAILAGLPFNNKDSEFTKNRNYIGSLTLNYRGDLMTLTSVTGLYNYTNDGTSFFDTDSLSLAGGGANASYKSVSEEVRAQTTFSGPFNVTFGVYYGHDTRTYRTFSEIIRFIDPTTGQSGTSSGTQHTVGQTMSGFAEGTYKITSTIELAGGARYTYEQKNGTAFNDYVSGPGAAFGVALPEGEVLRPRLRNNNVSPQATLSWHPTHDTTLYVGYRTGFKAGAISNPGLIPASFTAQNAVINPEKVHGFEGGFKFETSDRRLSGDISVYRYTFKDLQVSAFDSVSNTVLTTNAGGSRITGVEGNVNFRVTPEFDLHGAAGYNRARYTSFTNAACFGGQTVAQGCVNNEQDLTGQSLPRAPRVSGDAGAEYDLALSEKYNLSFSVDGRYSSKYNFVATNNPYAIQKSFATLDASARLTDSAKGWELAVIGRNLTNTFYYTVGSETPLGVSPGAIIGVPGLPRTVALQATYNF